MREGPLRDAERAFTVRLLVLAAASGATILAAGLSALVFAAVLAGVLRGLCECGDTENGREREIGEYMLHLHCENSLTLNEWRVLPQALEASGLSKGVERQERLRAEARG